MMNIIYLFCGITWISFIHAAGGHGPPQITTTPSTGTRRSPVQLGSYRVNQDQITLSGFSSGGTFAQQLQISYSSLFSGIGVFSHTYYRCGPGDGDQANFDNVCTTLGKFPNEKLYDPSKSADDIQSYYRKGLIENPINLRNKKLYVYTGTNNWLFSTDQSLRILDIYGPLIGNPLAIFTRVQTANLSLPTDSFGGSCPADSSANYFIANCGLNGPYEALKFLIGDSIQKPSRRPYLQPLEVFDQTEFYPKPLVRHDMDTQGYLYVPRSCKDGVNRCQLHFYFHGCLTGREFVDDKHIRNSGYMELAETNGIIMVFPQALKSPENDIGCWDTYNVTKGLFATQRGAQVITVKNMLDRILGSRFGSGSGSNNGYPPRPDPNNNGYPRPDPNKNGYPRPDPNNNRYPRPDTQFPTRDPDTVFSRPSSSSSSSISSGASSSSGRPGGLFSNNHNHNHNYYNKQNNNDDFSGFGDRSGWRRRNRDDSDPESFRFRYNFGFNPFVSIVPPLVQQ